LDKSHNNREFLKHFTLQNFYNSTSNTVRPSSHLTVKIANSFRLNAFISTARGPLKARGRVGDGCGSIHDNSCCGCTFVDNVE